MKTLVNRALFVLVMTLSFSKVVIGKEAEDEARYLIAIANEIENVKALAKKAEANTDVQSRTRFDYAALQHDLEQMQQAIERHAREPSRSPRAVSALHENYTRKVNDE
jgi:RAQPRD family integrative conjugative element protein